MTDIPFSRRTKFMSQNQRLFWVSSRENVEIFLRIYMLRE